MSEFYVYFQVGLSHVLDIHAYDHVLFLMALVLPFGIKEWRKILLLVSLFTLGHTTALVLSAMNLVGINATLVEFFIPVSIMLTAFHNLVTLEEVERQMDIKWQSVITLLFGIVHGLGFSNYFNSIVIGDFSEKSVPLAGFAIGIEVAQIAVVTAMTCCTYLVQKYSKIKKRDWYIIISSVIIGVVIPMIMESEIW